jgi:hypothetical protein
MMINRVYMMNLSIYLELTKVKILWYLKVTEEEYLTDLFLLEATTRYPSAVLADSKQLVAKKLQIPGPG